MSILRNLKYSVLLLALFAVPFTQIHAADKTEQELIQEAQVGTPKDKMKMGLRYAMGNLVKADDRQAEKWFALSAQENYAPAEVALAAMKAFDSDVQDIPGAMTLLRKAATQGNMQAQSELIRLLDSGTAKPATPDELDTWQKQSETSANEKKMASIWQLAATGAEKWQIPVDTPLDTIKKQAKKIDTPKSKGISLDINRIGHAVEQGDVVAKTVGAMLLATGNGIKKDPKLAKEWLMDAAKDGYAPAQGVVAHLYGIGWESFEKNDQVSAEWMKKAADSGLEDAELQYASMLVGDKGVINETGTSTQYLEKAVQTGNAQALMRLGLEKLSEDKRGESFKLLSQAVDTGDEQVLSVLGVLYGWGNAPVFNETAKMTEVRKYAERADKDAQLLLGLYYAEGWETPRNSSEALKWYSTAIQSGNQDALIPLALFYASENQPKEAAKSLASAVKNKAFGFLNEKKLLKMMFDRFENVPEVREMSALEAEKNPQYQIWRDSKIASQVDFLHKNASEKNPLANYLYALAVSENWINADNAESAGEIVKKSLSKLCSLSEKGIEKECQELKAE